MKNPGHVSREHLLFFLLGSLLFYLSASYFGGVYIRLARFWFVLQFLDFLVLMINVFSLRYFLDFSRDHISKGDTLSYSIKIQKGTFLPVPRVIAEQSRIHIRQDDGASIEPFSLNSRAIWHYDRDVHALLRGIYTLGLSRLSVRSFNGLFTVDLPIWVKTFYVYPRLIDLSGVLIRHRSRGGKSRALSGREGDAYMFEGLREYRAGESLKDISWSGFMKKGVPLIRTYSSRGGSDIHLFMDRRASGRSPVCDDTVLEIFLCLVNTALHTGQKMVIHGYPGWENRCLITEEELKTLFQTTLTLEFDVPGIEGLKDIPSDGALYVITSLPDPGLLDEYSHMKSIDHLIAVTNGMEDEELARIRALIMTLRMNGSIITEVNSPDRLEEDLSCLFSF